MMKHILFDLDGTLTDPMIGITKSVQYALKHFGIEVADLRELIPFIGPPLRESFEKYYDLTPEQSEEAVEVYREYYGPTGIFENAVYPGVPEILEQLLAAGAQLYVATSKPTVYAGQILEHYDIRDPFTFVCGSELNGERVKKADVIQHILDKYQIAPEDAVMVGDRHHDIEGAAACHVPSLGVLFGYGTREELEEAGADHIVATVEEMGAYLLHQLT